MELFRRRARGNRQRIRGTDERAKPCDDAHINNADSRPPSKLFHLDFSFFLNVDSESPRAGSSSLH
jgi:hypothetical protein